MALPPPRDSIGAGTVARAARTPPPNSPKIMTNSYTLRAGDVVEYAGQPCRVIRVSESAALVAVIQKPRTITPRFGKPVTIQPSPKLERISPNSEIPILNR